jgi:hypothetical protein
MLSQETVDAIPPGLEEAYWEVRDLVSTAATLLVASYAGLDGVVDQHQGQNRYTLNQTSYYLDRISTTYPGTDTELPAFPNTTVDAVIVTHKKLVPVYDGEISLVPSRTDAQIKTMLTRNYTNRPMGYGFSIGIDDIGSVAIPGISSFGGHFMGPGQEVLRDNNSTRGKLELNELRAAFLGGLMDSVVIADTVVEAAARSNVSDRMMELYLDLAALGLSELEEGTPISVQPFTESWRTAKELSVDVNVL